MSKHSKSPERPRSPLSVVICAFNGLGYTQLLIDSLRRFSAYEHEIVVWSDGSSDETEAWLIKQADLKWHHDPVNRGICTAMNRAAELASRKYLFFPNTDHVLAPGWDEALLRRLRPRTVVSLSCIEPGIVPVAQIFHTVNLGSRWEEFDWPGFEQAAHRLSKPVATPGVNYPFALSRTLWNEVGALDERFNPGPANDPDLFYRLHLAGAEFIRAEDCLAYHFSGKSSRLAGEATAEHRAWREVTDRNEARFAEKWGERYRYKNGGLPEPGPEAAHRALEAIKSASGSPPLRVLFDARSIRAESDGIGAYACGLLKALRHRSADVELQVLVNDPAVLRIRLGGLGGLVVRALHAKPGDAAAESREIQALEASLRPDLFHGPAFDLPSGLSCPAVVTVHDIAFEIRPDWYPKPFVDHMRQVVRNALAQASCVIAVSRRTADDLVEKFGINADRVRVVHEAPAEESPVVARSTPSPASVTKQYFISIGVRQPRKNALGLLSAFRALREKNPGARPSLVLTLATECEDPAARAELSRMGPEHGVIALGHVPDDELSRLLAGARALVYPSRYEGFGLPVLEAMTAGIPVICSNAGALPEVAGDAAIVVPAGDVLALTEALERVLKDDELCRTMILKGHARALEFSWDTAAAETLDVYRAAVKAGSRRSESRYVPEQKKPNHRRAVLPTERIRVAVDARMALAPTTGTGRYTREILPRLMNASSDAEFVLIGPECLDEITLPEKARVVSTVGAGAESLLNPVWEQFSQVAALAACDVLFSPTGILPVVSECPGVVVVHDLAFEDRPQDFEPRLREHLTRWVRRSCLSAKRLICVSEFTRDRVAARYSIPQERLKVVHHGGSGARPRPSGTLPVDPVILCVSAFEPNKNQTVLLRALVTARSVPSARLVLAGRKGRALESLKSLAKSLGIEDRVSFEVDASDSKLEQLFDSASIFAFPSFYEGFGLPLLEAMSRGLPILASDIPACREVLGSVGQFVAPEDSASWATHLSELLSSHALLRDCEVASRGRASSFNWDVAAASVWRELVEVARQS